MVLLLVTQFSSYLTQLKQNGEENVTTIRCAEKLLEKLTD
jgi:hypothetical protein